MTVDLASLLVGAAIGAVVTLAASVVVSVTRPRSSSTLPEAVTHPEVESLKKQIEQEHRNTEVQKQEVHDETTRMVRAGDLGDLGRVFDES